LDSCTLERKRLGHTGSSEMEQFLRSGSKGVPTSVEAPKEVCSGCMMGKQAWKKFPKQAKQASKGPLDLVHADSGGPLQVYTVGGRKLHAYNCG
jgi:hypothetical protein